MNNSRQVYVTTWFRELGIVLCELDSQRVDYGSNEAVVCPEKWALLVPHSDVHATLESAQTQVDGWIASEVSRG